MGCKRFFLKERKIVTFLNKIDLLYRLVVFFVVCPRLRPFWSVFGELALFWCSTAKRKTRPKSDFRSVHRSRRIIPLENYLRPQFLQKLKAEMLQFHVHSLDSKFFPQIVHKRCFYLGSSGPRPTSKPVSSQCGLDKNLSRGSRELTGLFVDCRPQATLAGLILVTRHTMQSVNWSTAESLVRNSEADRARA